MRASRQAPEALVVDEQKKILIFRRRDCIFAANFNPTDSFSDYGFAAPGGQYELVLDTDEADYDGFSLIERGEKHLTVAQKSPNGPQEYNDTLYLYLPARTMQVLRKVD